MDPKFLVRASKFFSSILRHNAEKEGIEMRKDGFVRLNDLMAHKTIKKWKLTRGHVDRVVNDNNKKRFEMKQEEGGVWLIRAVQGHSITSV